MRANDKQLDSLHGALCGYFLKLIGGEIPEMIEQTVESTDEDGTKTSLKTWVTTGLMVRPGAGDLAVMAKFLKDNAITGALVEGGQLSDLEKQLAQRHARRGKLPTEKDAQEALREVGAKLLQ